MNKSINQKINSYIKGKKNIFLILIYKKILIKEDPTFVRSSYLNLVNLIT